MLLLAALSMPGAAQQAGEAPKAAPAAAPAASATKPKPEKIEELSLSATVGELLRRDAAEALNPTLGKDAPVLPQLPTAPVVKAPDPYLASIFGMEGGRIIRLKLADKPILTYVENVRDTDKREPNWRLLAVEGRCAYFENTEPTKTKKSAPKSLQQKVCYGPAAPVAPPLATVSSLPVSSNQRLPSPASR
jgi:hypothetical protein